ncbi:CGP-CTERM sorting domain-containing protein [Thermococcus sp. 21S9]|uniref:CGP-CTERM sorting domain-containing protein n=1 Tax=Thermococcus sp. 21S9 TaxID=1638223 RepID=UPI001438DEE3|nr:CGP-CTERM sorting domain-containing protein [Thermococcus sp. 21S9]NJE55575.1 CGP-CTERM sorting domain-containing protein [Thermococcus sp. 21S9]
MKKVAVLLAAVVLLSVFGVVASPMVSAADTGKVVIAVDLAHGENPKGLDDVTYKGKVLTPGMLKTLTQYTFVYFGDPKYEADLGIKRLGDKITYDALKSNNVTILILGQPTSPLLPDEIKAIRQWLEEGGKVLWVAGDSDYGNGAKTQQFVDSLLDQLNITNLRVDLASVEDAVSNAGGKSYRVIAYDDPWKDTPKRDILVQNLKYGGKVLAHGPGVVAWVDGKDGSGNWHPLTPNSKPDEAYVIVHSNSSSDITENNAPAANAYQAGQTGEFPIVAAQIVKVGDNKKPDVIIVSGETPIGGYEPMWAGEYYGVKLDGPTVITNILEWSVEMTKEAPTSTSSSGGSSGICGPAFIVGLAVLPLLLRRRK